MSKNILLVSLAALSTISLSGCTAMALMDAGSLGIFQEENINLAERNYAAADYMAHQARSFIQEQTIIKVIAIGEEYEPNISSRIGHIIPEQVGTRLAQLGYSVDLSEVMDEEQPATFGATVDNAEHRARHAGRTPSRMLLTGTYRRLGQELQVSLRLMETSSGRVVGAMDYAVPMTRDIADLSAPRPRIFKIPQ